MRVRRFASVAGLLGASVLMHSLGEAARSARQTWPAEESYVTLPSPAAARWSYLGYNQLAADLTWSRLLVYYGTGFIGEGDFRYLGKFVENIIALDPGFKKVYQWASYTVTVNEEHRVSSKEEDIRQSIEILEGAMREFPEDYEFFWLAGIRYFLDLKSDDEETQRAYREKGAEYLEMAMQKPNAPKDLATKAASFRSQLGQFEQAQSNLMQMIMTTDDLNAQKKMLDSFAAVATEALRQELAEAAKELRDLRARHLPSAPADIFVLLGGPPASAVIDFELLATERVLFGANDANGVELFE